MLYDFLFKEEYTLIALDIIEGLDDNFYVVDINGFVSLNPILQYTEEFVSNIIKSVGPDFYFDCFEELIDYDKLNIGSKDPSSSITIKNRGFSYENKLKWRRFFKINSPNINEEVNFHSNDYYPKYLIKPPNGLRSKGIKLFNDESPKLENRKPSEMQSQIVEILEVFTKYKIHTEDFVEEFIPSKLIDDHCYSIRVLMIINESESYPVLKLHRLCANPVIKNLKRGQLTFEESLSYLTNVTDVNKKFYKHDCPKLDEFLKTIRIFN